MPDGWTAVPDPNAGKTPDKKRSHRRRSSKKKPQSDPKPDNPFHGMPPIGGIGFDGCGASCMGSPKTSSSSSKKGEVAVTIVRINFNLADIINGSSKGLADVAKVVALAFMNRKD